MNKNKFPFTSANFPRVRSFFHTSPVIDHLEDVKSNQLVDRYKSAPPLGIELPYGAQPIGEKQPWQTIDISELSARMENEFGSTFWISAYLVLLARYADGDDICIGFPKSKDAENFARGIPIFHFQYMGNETGSELLCRVDNELLEIATLIQNRKISFKTLESYSRHSCAIIASDYLDLSSNVWLALILSEDGRIRLAMRGDIRSTELEVLDLNVLVEHLVKIALEIKDHPYLPIGNIDILTEVEKFAVKKFSGSENENFTRGLLHELFIDQAIRSPEKIALYSKDGSMTYSELNDASHILAIRLSMLGIISGSKVGICLKRDSNLIVALLAVLRAGACYVPLDPDYPKERTQYMLLDSGCDLILVDNDENLFYEIDCEILNITSQNYNDNSLSTDKSGGIDGLGSSSLAYIIYTSGSTGKPKGVAIEHGSAYAFLKWAKKTFNFAEWRGTLAATSVCFDLSIFEIFGTLSCGGSIHLVDNLLALDYYFLCEQITMINTVPSVLNAYLALKPLPSSVCTVNLAGEPLNGELVRKIFQHSDASRVLNLYGPTECTVYATSYEIPLKSDRNVQVFSEPPIGKPIPGTTVYILDTFGLPVPLGISGELYLGGDRLAQGYFGKTDQTSQSFVRLNTDTPEIEHDRVYRTGDRVRYTREGFLRYLGRMDEQVKFNGFRIELGEINSALMEIPEVDEAATIMVSDGNNPKIVTYFTSDKTISSLALVEHLLEVLPRYMIPSRFIHIPMIPKTLNGKVDKGKLRILQNCVSSAPIDEAYDEFKSIVEQKWLEVLGNDATLDKDFFTNGGNSLQAVYLIAYLKQKFKREISLQDFLFGETTVKALSDLIYNASPEITMDNINVNESLVSFAEQRLCIQQYLDPNSTAYNLLALLKVSGVTLEKLSEALKKLLDHHIALRRRIVFTSNNFEAIVDPTDRVPIEIITLDSETEVENSLKKIIKQMQQRPFVLSSEPPTLITLIFVRNTKQIRIVLTVHHCAFDDISLSIFSRDLVVLLDGKNLSPCQLTPGAVATLEKTDEQMKRHNVFADRWALHICSTLSNEDSLILPPVANQQRLAQQVRTQISDITYQAMDCLALRFGVTRFSVALTAFACLIAKMNNCSYALVGIAFAGRYKVEMQTLIGCFVTMLPILLTETHQKPELLIKSVGSSLVELLAHQDIPMEKIRDRLQRKGVNGINIRYACGEYVKRNNVQIGQECWIETADFIPSTQARLDLTLWLESDPNGINAIWTYAEDLYYTQDIIKLHTEWEVWLQSVAEIALE